MKPDSLSFRQNSEASLKCVNLASIDISSVRARWSVLLAYNKTLDRLLSLAHTGWTHKPHSLGARICALRFLLMWDVKLKFWEVRRGGGWRVECGRSARVVCHVGPNFHILGW